MIDTALALTNPAAAVVATIPVGTVAADVALSPDGRYAFVVNQYGNTISVIDTATNEVVDTLSVAGFFDPRAITAQYSDYSVNVLRGAGVSASTLKAAGLSANALYQGGFTAAELLAAGVTRSELRDIGVVLAAPVPALPAWAILLLAGLLGRTALRPRCWQRQG